MENAVPHWVVLQATDVAGPFSDRVYRELKGSEAEARAAMLEIVDTFGQAASEKKRLRQRRQVFQLSERRYFVRVHNSYSNEEGYFTLAELIADTHDDDLPDTAGKAIEDQAIEQQ
ncbi:hypothetical protein OG458_41270 [Streptomyces sp. NBC_01281]|uniref:hypothetical protein n=1 Tax=unclassified Streptomyces TaxID=2593676 RepID=UPI002E167E13|nr:hypothetical protein OG458_00015 [Streptomyces sp. NBC_01281]WSK65822.1 hypothetical protein OG458_41270 [Streptomyces sp. NBC_01281]